MLIAKLALRNLGRNARRSAVTGLALAFSAALCIAYYALVDGMNAQLVHALTRFDLGHLQVHRTGYTARRALEATIPSGREVLDRVRKDAGVRAASPRVYAPALVGAGTHSTGVQLIGVEPSSEREVTELHKQLTAGSFLDAEPTPWPRARELSAKERARDEQLTATEAERAADEIDALPGVAEPGEAPRAAAGGDRETTPGGEAQRIAAALSPRPERPPHVVLGATLAHVLGVKVGSELFLSAQAVDGSAEGVRVQVAGIYETGTTTYDRARVYLHVVDLSRLVHLDGGIHEIAAVADSSAAAPAVAQRLRATLGGTDDLDVRAWDELRPDMVRLLDLNRASSALLAIIVFFVASLGVVNTMLMAVLERTRELGVLKAIGMSGTSVFSMIVAETAVLALAGGTAGTLLGLGLDWYLVRHGVDLGFIMGKVSFGGVAMQPVVRGEITPGGVLWPIAVLTAVCVLAAIYPAWRASRMQPAVGMRET